MPVWQGALASLERDVLLILPEGMLIFFGLAILPTDFLLEKERKKWNALTALCGLGFSGISLWLLRPLALQSPGAFAGTVVVDRFFILFSFVFLAAAIFAVLLSIGNLEIEREQNGEYYALVLISCAGMMFAACGNDLVVLFVAIEMMSLSCYILSGFTPGNRRSNEGALKYALLGTFTSAVLVYGFSLLYGLAGSTNLTAIASSVQERGPNDILAVVAMVAVAAGILFKIGAVPFHQWVPDVGEGAPSPIAAYLTVAPVAVGFAVLLRLFVWVLWPLRADWLVLVEVAAILSLTVGNFAAMTQTNIKRLLAYSSISHAGYILLGLVAAVNRADGSLNRQGLQAMIFYLLVYAFFNVGAFSIVVLLRRKNVIGDEIHHLDGLARRNPGAAALMLIFLLSLAGIPPTAGFLAKLMIFIALVNAGHLALAIVSVLYILPAVYYYARLMANMWMREPADAASLTITPPQRLALGAMALVTLVAGIFPGPFLQVVTRSLLLPFGH